MPDSLPDSYSLAANEVAWLEKHPHFFPIHPRDVSLSRNDLKVYFGQHNGNVVRLRAMLITGASYRDRSHSIKTILLKMQRWRHLKSPNLISILGFATSSEHPLFQVVSYCPSTTIMEYLQTHPHHDKLTSCIDIAAGVDYLHRSSIVHGAIRGSNILVKEDGTCFLGEFASEDIPANETLTRFANWTAPELMDHKAFWKIHVDNYRDHDYQGEYKIQSDIFAMGCTALEIYTGRPPAPLSIPYSDVKSFKDLTDLKREPVQEEQKLIPPRVLGAILTMIDYVPFRRPDSGNALRWFIRPETIRTTAAPPVLAKSMMRRLVHSPNFP